MSRSGLTLALLLLLSACRDEVAEGFARAQLRYDALVSEGARPDDARFDPVLAALEQVPPASRHHAKAQALIRGLVGGRARSRVRTPLTLAPDTGRAPELQAQLAACARLAAMAGADGGVDHRALVALEACRLAAEKLELRLSHADEYPQDGGHL